MKRAVIGVIILLSSCSSTDPEKELVATEIPEKETVQVDLPQAELFETAKRAYAGSVYTVAIDAFQGIRDGYSPGPYSEFAEIKLADCQFEGNEFDVAASLYEEFIKNHPSSSALPYALLRAGRSLELHNKGVGKNVVPLEKARDYYQKLNEQYPDSVYAGAARKYHAAVIQKLAEYEKLVGDFYKKKENEQAYQARANLYDKKWQPLVEASLKVQAEQNVVPDAPEVQHEIARAELANRARVSVSRKVPDKMQLASEEPASNAQYRVQSIQCQRGATPAVFIFLNKPIENSEFLSRISQLEPKDDTITLELPDCGSKEFSVSCFKEKDLFTTRDCKISIKTDEPLSTLALANPPRLLLAQ